MRAEALSDTQVHELLRFISARTAYPRRNRVIALLSFRAGLRAKEIASVRWRMLVDPSGRLRATAAIGSVRRDGSQRLIRLDARLRAAIDALRCHESQRRDVSLDEYVITFRKGRTDLASRSNTVRFLFKYWYAKLGFARASSHSGRKTFILKLARRAEMSGSHHVEVEHAES
jgi:integrase